MAAIRTGQGRQRGEADGGADAPMHRKPPPAPHLRGDVRWGRGVAVAESGILHGRPDSFYGFVAVQKLFILFICTVCLIACGALALVIAIGLDSR